MTTEEERQKIRERQRGYRSDEIIVFKAVEPVSIRDTSVKIRVCAYCRVSTDNLEQESSFELQNLHYREYIAQHDNWELVNIYADEGISGTSLKHRDAFKAMIQDCRDGKIDLIVVKSVSRFARNVVDCIETVRELKRLNPPVRVYFELEGIDTADSTSDVILNILAIFAQEESHNKSESMNWSIDNRFSRGNFLTPRLFGYEIDPDKPDRYIIVEEEAEIVRLVYSMYITGSSPKEIAETMSKLNYVSNIHGDRKWNAAVVNNIITNERRCGMIIARKTYTVDFTTHAKRININQRNKYQLDDHHEGIVAKDLYDEVLRIKNLRRQRYYEAIPTLSVIKEGVLKGFVPVAINYPGFTYENYVFASDFAYTKDKNGNAIRDSFRTLDKRDVCPIDLSGYEKVDSQLFSRSGKPVLWFKQKQLYFNKACLGKMNDSNYIELLFEPAEKLLAIRSCDEENQYAIEWAKDSGDKLTTKIKTSSGFSSILFKCMNWEAGDRYRLIGVKRAKGNDIVVLFDLNTAEKIHREEVFNESEDEREIKITNSIDEYLLEHFGNDVYQDVYSMRLYLMDLLKKWHLDAEIVPIEEPKEWLTKAKELVKKHLSKLMEEKYVG